MIHNTYSLVILGYKSLDNLKRALAEAELSSLPPTEIVIIINYYSDISKKILDFVQQDNRVTRWAYSSQNMGIATGWNLGINLSTIDRVIVLSDDCSVKANTYKTMVAGFDNPKAGIVGPKGGSFLGISHVTGCLFAVSKKMTSLIGGCSELSTPLGDEVEFCFRAKANGWDVIYVDAPHSHTFNISAKPNETINYLGIEMKVKDFQKVRIPLLHQQIAKHIKKIK
jgi:GT2 family glycosyltransferase